MIILCGSSVSVMKKETTDYDRPLYGRFFNKLEVKPLSLKDCAKLHTRMSDIDLIRLYLTVGGIPSYHMYDAKTYQEFVEEHFLSDSAELREEGFFLIASEFAPGRKYLGVINTLGDGSSSVKEISEKTQIERTTCKRILDDLVSVEMVETVMPMFDAPKRPVYRIKDPLIAFCQNISTKVGPYTLLSPAEKYSILSHDIDTLLGFRFEDLCKQYVENNWNCVSIGKWWGRDKFETIREIDIAAIVIENGLKSALYSECKFTKKPVSENVLKDLEECSSYVRTDLSARYVLFSRSGFTEELKDIAKERGIVLVGIPELMAGHAIDP